MRYLEQRRNLPKNATPIAELPAAPPSVVIMHPGPTLDYFASPSGSGSGRSRRPVFTELMNEGDPAGFTQHEDADRRLS